jgi:hypothetical protein
VPYEYVGAKQDELITAQADRDFSSASNWTNHSIGYDSYDETGDLSLTWTSEKYATLGTAYYGPLEGGKKYRLTYTASGVTGSGYIYFVFGVTNQWFSGDLVARGNGTHSVEFVFQDTGSILWLTSGGSGSITIDDLSLTQIGCVAEYLPSGINATQWVDTSGNNLHGTTSTATAVNHTTGTLTLESGANLKMQDGGGIDFTNYTDGSVAGTSGLEVLKDYEEGTWTPAFSLGSGTVNTTTPPIVTNGKYTKIGNRVFCTGVITATTTGFSSPSGTLDVSGLPFYAAASGDNAGYAGVTFGWISNFNIGTDYQITAAVEINSTKFRILGLADDSGAVNTGAYMNNDTQFTFSVCYYVG